MLKANALILNGKSTADLPFFVAVEEMPGLQKASKKDKLYNLEHVNGVVVQSIQAWESIKAEFKLYLHEATRSDLRILKAMIPPQGTFTRYDDPDIHMSYVSVEIESAPMDLVKGYEVGLSFVCEPFEYEQEQMITLGNELVNHTTAPMYPKIEIKGSTSSQTSLTIGNQTMYFSEIERPLIIECKHGLQNVTNDLDQPKNNITKGAFFEIQPGKNKVVKGAGITEVKMLTRWGWL